MSSEEAPILPLPSAPPRQVNEYVTLQPPLTHRGTGPAIILVIDSVVDLGRSAQYLDPPPLQKWAEEGFSVAQIVVPVDHEGRWDLPEHFLKSVEAISTLPGTEGKIGLITYSNIAHSLVSVASKLLSRVGAVISFNGAKAIPDIPHLIHSPSSVAEASQAISEAKVHTYPVNSQWFTIPNHADFDSSASALSHTRSLTFLKPLLGGPYFNLEVIWDEHTAYEFANRSVERTMSTMVQEPYVNHVPTMTGGIGREKLTAFYKDHFIYNNPADTGLTLVSRTVGIDRVIDEFLFHYTHDKVVDWMLPGIPPTGKLVKVPFTSIVNIRGDRLYHEHIAWDQASVLRQIGLLPEYLPFPYPLPDGRTPAPGKRFEYQVPTAGTETAQKLVDENSIESNGMFQFKIREVDDI